MLGLSKYRRYRTEHPSRSWQLYRCPDDETGRTTGRRDRLTGDDEALDVATGQA